MRLRLQLLGSGQENDPYRVDLPTYDLVEIMAPDYQAIVDVPAVDTDVLRAHLAPSDEVQHAGTYVYTRLSVAGHDDWWRFLSERYPDARRYFKPLVI